MLQHCCPQEARAADYQASTAARSQQRAELEARVAACKAEAADAAQQVQGVESDMAQLQRHKLELVAQLKQAIQREEAQGKAVPPRASAHPDAHHMLPPTFHAAQQAASWSLVDEQEPPSMQ